MDNFDTVIAGKCEHCGENGRLVVDPYDQDVNDEASLVYLCETCENERALDI